MVVKKGQQCKKKVSICILYFLLFFNLNVYTQIGINTNVPDNSSALDIVSKNRGVLLPRMTTLERLAILKPADALLVYDTSLNRLFIYDLDSSSWKRVITEDDYINSSVIQYDIFLIAGQSNTHFGLGLDNKLDFSIPSVYQIGRFNGFDGKIIPATEPLHHWTSKADRIGFALTFAKKYAQTQLGFGRKVLLIPCGYDGSSIEQWAKGGTLYNDAVQRTINALINNPGSKIMGVLWHQGEANVGFNNYVTNLDNFINNLRNDLGDNSIPFVLGGMVPYWVNLNTNRSSQQELIKNTPNRLNKCAYADPTIPSVISKSNSSFEEIHYDAEGQRILGERYFSAFLTLNK